MFWYFLVLVIGLIVCFSYLNAMKRKERLASVTPEVRERFLRIEEKRQKKERLELRMKAAKRLKKQDSQAARDHGVSRQVEVARAEGRKFVRVWVPAGKVQGIIRWARRNGLRAMRVKDGTQGDVQISITRADQKAL